MSLTHRPPALKGTPEMNCPRGGRARSKTRDGAALEGRVYRKKEPQEQGLGVGVGGCLSDREQKGFRTDTTQPVVQAEKTRRLWAVPTDPASSVRTRRDGGIHSSWARGPYLNSNTDQVASA